jgi:hypothetical protein
LLHVTFEHTSTDVSDEERKYHEKLRDYEWTRSGFWNGKNDEGWNGGAGRVIGGRVPCSNSEKVRILTATNVPPVTHDIAWFYQLKKCFYYLERERNTTFLHGVAEDFSNFIRDEMNYVPDDGVEKELLTTYGAVMDACSHVSALGSVRVPFDASKKKLTQLLQWKASDVTVLAVKLKSCFARQVDVKTSMFPRDKPDQAKTLKTQTHAVKADGLVQFRYHRQKRECLGAKFNVGYSRQFVIIQMIVDQDESVQTLHGSIDLVKETQKNTCEISVQLTGNEALPNAITCEVRVRLKPGDFAPVLLPLEKCLYKIKKATKQLESFNAKHADNEVRDTLSSLIVIATHRAKNFLKDLLNCEISQEVIDSIKDEDGVKDEDEFAELLEIQTEQKERVNELLENYKVHVDNLLGYEPCLTKNDN